MKLHTKYQRPGFLVSDKKLFKVLPRSLFKNFGRSVKRSRSGIILSNFIGPMSPLLHTKPRGHSPFGFRRKRFLKGVTIYGHGGHLDQVIQMLRTNCRSPGPCRLHVKFGFDWRVVSEERTYEERGCMYMSM